MLKIESCMIRKYYSEILTIRSIIRFWKILPSNTLTKIAKDSYETLFRESIMGISPLFFHRS